MASSDTLPVLSKMNLEDNNVGVQDNVVEQVVNPFEVTAPDERGVDYDKLIETFGTRRIDQAMLERFEKLTGRRPHRYLRREHFFSQRFDGTRMLACSQKRSRNHP